MFHLLNYFFNKYNCFFESLFDECYIYLLTIKKLIDLLTHRLIDFFTIFAKNIFYGTDFIAFILFHIPFSDNLSVQEVIDNE
jgi:hypothetical protein